MPLRRVIDDGIGIAEDKLGVIFMPFGQARWGCTTLMQFTCSLKAPGSNPRLEHMN